MALGFAKIKNGLYYPPPPKDMLVSFAVAVEAYNAGKTVYMEIEDGRFYLMDSRTTFTSNIEYMNNANWMIGYC